MKVSIANITPSIPAAEFRAAVHAVERQVREDFAPAWGMVADVRMAQVQLGTKPSPELKRSDVVVYVADSTTAANVGERVLGYHFEQLNGVPFGVVFADIAQAAGEPWSSTLSHEVLELIADPEVNLLVAAPHPERVDESALRPYEVCDPVQADLYSIDGVAVSNFVLPLYFAALDSPAQVATNFLELPLDRFGVRPGGYYSYLDLRDMQFHDRFGDMEAKHRLPKLREARGQTRRQLRRQNALRLSKP